MSARKPRPNRKKKGSGKEASAHVVADRMEEIENLLAAATPTNAIERALSVQWSVTRRAVRTYIKRVRDRWVAEAGREQREERRAAIRASLNAALNLAARNGEVSGILRAAEQLALLDGLREPVRTETKHEHSGGGPMVVGFASIEEATRYAREGRVK